MFNKDLKLISDDLKERAPAAAGEGITIVDAHLPEGGLLVNIYPLHVPGCFQFALTIKSRQIFLSKFRSFCLH